MSLFSYPPLPESQTNAPPPPPDTDGTYFYGYKIFDNFDGSIEDHAERLGRVFVAVARTSLYAHVTSNSSTVMVFLAIYSPKVNIITPRAGNSRIPCPTWLEEFQQNMGVDYGPTWHADDGTIFRKNYTPEEYARSRQPIKGLWSLE